MEWVHHGSLSVATPTYVYSLAVGRGAEQSGMQGEWLHHLRQQKVQCVEEHNIMVSHPVNDITVALCQGLLQLTSSTGAGGPMSPAGRAYHDGCHTHRNQPLVPCQLPERNCIYRIAGLYDSPAVDLYSRHHMGELPPHIFAVANECYRCLWKRHDSQCVLISGESGAGKTESTKLLLKFLSVMSQKSSGTPPSEKTTRVEQAIVQSSPIMEAFGNAKTVYNNNSSRFGKFIQLHFSQGGNIQGGCIIDCILHHLKNRVVRQNPGERNYHIFYALLSGTDKDHKDMYYLCEGPESYHYLSQSGCVQDVSLDDKNLFDSVMVRKTRNT
ncbi:hypothetical protein CRUP_011337 [Coryphaenoides rupestris]|nr:hypothetical protein CRUP_011337 [Coryphaenoides rupestris]